jgi:hypothetical protein
MGIPYWIHNTGNRILDSGYWNLDTRFWIRYIVVDTGFLILDSRFWILDSGTGFWILYTGF